MEQKNKKGDASAYKSWYYCAVCRPGGEDGIRDGWHDNWTLSTFKGGGAGLFFPDFAGLSGVSQRELRTASMKCLACLKNLIGSLPFKSAGHQPGLSVDKLKN